MYYHIKLEVIVEVESSEEIPYVRAVELAKKNIHDSSLTEHGEKYVSCKILEVH